MVSAHSSCSIYLHALSTQHLFELQGVVLLQTHIICSIQSGVSFTSSGSEIGVLSCYWCPSAHSPQGLGLADYYSWVFSTRWPANESSSSIQHMFVVGGRVDKNGADVWQCCSFLPHTKPCLWCICVFHLITSWHKDSVQLNITEWCIYTPDGIKVISCVGCFPMLTVFPSAFFNLHFEISH